MQHVDQVTKKRIPEAKKGEHFRPSWARWRCATCKQWRERMLQCPVCDHA